MPLITSKIDELIDIPLIQKWLDNFHELTGMTSALIGKDGTIYTKSGWQDICTNFHRVHPVTCALCVESDQYINDHLDEGVVGYSCKNGLHDYAAPIIIGGEHVASLFTGQLFHTPPNRKFFEEQARKYGFPLHDYLQALEKVPVIAEKKAKATLRFITHTTEILADIGNKNLERLQEKESELRKSEERFHRAIRDSAIPTILFNSSMRVFEISRGIPQTTGYAREEITDLAEWLSAISPEGKGALQKILLSLQEHPTSVASEKITLYPKNEETHFWEIHCVDLGHFSEDSRLYELLAQDVTQREHFQKTLLETLEKLGESNKDLQHFAYITSHDLQEPLRMVSSYLQLLQQRYKGQLGEDADDFIYYAVDGANRMKRLIQDILSYSRITTHGKEFGEVSVEGVLEKVLQFLELKRQEKNARIVWAPLPTVWGDPTQIEQLLQNLIDNALKFSASENPLVEISAEPQGEMWVLHVADNGIGINENYFEKIFFMFQRLNRSEDYPGTGLGLALCKRIVERHGGRIWVSSEEGKGTTFSFSLRGIANNSSKGGAPYDPSGKIS